MELYKVGRRVRSAFCFLVMAMLFVGGTSSNELENLKDVTELVQFTPNILLQLAPHVSQEIKLNARGGSRDYNWSSSDMSIVTVSSHGIIHAKRPGIATVKAVSTSHPQNFYEIVVKVMSAEDVCYDMELGHNNDPLEPYISKISLFYLKQTLRVYCHLAVIMALVYYFWLRRSRYVLPNNHYLKKRYRWPPKRRLGARRNTIVLKTFELD